MNAALPLRHIPGPAQVGVQAYLMWEKAGKPEGADFSNDARRSLEQQLASGTSVQDLERLIKAPSAPPAEAPRKVLSFPRWLRHACLLTEKLVRKCKDVCPYHREWQWAHDGLACRYLECSHAHVGGSLLKGPLPHAVRRRLSRRPSRRHLRQPQRPPRATSPSWGSPFPRLRATRCRSSTRQRPC